VLGMFTVWGDGRVGRLIGRFTGFGPADLDAGRPLQRVSEYISGEADARERDAEESGRPEATVTWYHRARATYEAKRIQFAQQGVRYPGDAANEATKREAFALIIQRPIKHAAMMLPLVWRVAPRAFVVLVVAFVYALRRGRVDVALFVLPAIFLALFYAAASQSERRFGYVIDPIATVAALVLLAALLSSKRLAPHKDGGELPSRPSPEDVVPPRAVIPEKDHTGRLNLSQHHVPVSSFDQEPQDRLIEE
jgi:hypothetical protein